MDYIWARPEGENVYNPYTPKRWSITDVIRQLSFSM